MPQCLLVAGEQSESEAMLFRDVLENNQITSISELELCVLLFDVRNNEREL